jgi:hypothetical protein
MNQAARNGVRSNTNLTETLAEGIIKIHYAEKITNLKFTGDDKNEKCVGLILR